LLPNGTQAAQALTQALLRLEAPIGTNIFLAASKHLHASSEINIASPNCNTHTSGEDLKYLGLCDFVPRPAAALGSRQARRAQGILRTAWRHQLERNPTDRVASGPGISGLSSSPP